MKKLLLTLLKLVVVAALMWWALSAVHFGDRMVWLGGPEGRDVVHEQEIEIVGSWKSDPVRFVLPDESTEQEVARGTVDERGTVDIQPGFLTYWRSLDPLLFGLGALCFCITVMISGARWWWLLRVNGTDVTLAETLRRWLARGAEVLG